MAPKKTIADQIGARLSPICRHPEESGEDEQEEFNPPLNQHVASDFDKIVGFPTLKDKGYTACFASIASTRAKTNP